MNTFYADGSMKELVRRAESAAAADCAGETDNPTLRLLLGLEAEGVRYCHWKSNVRLSGTLSGDEDIDILIDRRQAERFQSVVSAQGFKLARSRLGSDYPGVFHAIGLDETRGELLDLHAYHRVLSGDSFVKTYLFPVAEALLQGDARHLGVRVPSAEAEYVIFILRIALKSLAPVEIWKCNLHYDEVIEELAWLRARADRSRAAALCSELFPSVDDALFRKAEAAIEERGALLRRILIGIVLSWRLRHLRRLGPVRGLLAHVARLFTYALARFQKRRDGVPRAGGVIVALVGPKATGKSTISNALAKRFGKHLDVVQIHAGKPPPTLLSALPRLFVPLARRLFPAERLREYETPERRKSRQYSLFYVIRMTLLAYDRRKLLLRAHRRSAAGTIVISDRYPSQQVGAIDSSCFDDAAVVLAGSRIKRRLMKWERRLYRDLPRPDIVLQLHAPIELALERDGSRIKEGGPDAEAVRRRWWIESDVDFPDTPLEPIDTQLPVEQSVLNAMNAVWKLI